MLEIQVTDRWHETFTGGHTGVLLIGNVDNAKRPTSLDKRKREVEADLRDRFGALTRAELFEHEILKAYRTYYKKFKKTYHVQLQLESIVHKGKSLPNVNPLVDANFTAELDTLILTAGHDADLLVPPITIDATLGDEPFVQMNGAEISLKPDDMMMADAQGVICTIIYGQDNRSPISPKTKRALYVAYAPPGISATSVQEQLDAIRDNVRLFAPDADIELCEVYTA